MATGYLEHTVGTPGTNGNKKLTFSAWIKRGGIDTEQSFYVTRTDGSNFVRFRFLDTNYINITSNTSGTNYYATTNRLFRDTSAWYHIVIAYDTTQGSSADRIKMYVNGTQETFSASNYPAQDATLYMLASGQPQRIGQESGNAYFNGSMTHVHYTEGHAYAASTFGETDSVSGIWKPKTAPSVTYGTNGFFLKFENGAAMGTDSSGQSNTFTVNNSVTQNVDTPSNNFATLNVLASTTSQNEFQYGNLEHYGTSNWTGAVTTLGVSSGKYYAEVKVTDRDNFSVGIVTLSGTAINNINTNNNGKVGKYVDSWGIEGSGSNLSKGNNGSASSYGSAFTNNDIAMIALDVGTGSNGAVYFGKNGTWFDSGNPATGSNPAFSSLSFSDAVGFMSGLETGRVQWNFGQGYFGTTQVASANADANGHGIFEYAVPSGYYTLNTKNIKEFG